MLQASFQVYINNCKVGPPPKVQLNKNISKYSQLLYKYLKEAQIILM